MASSSLVRTLGSGAMAACLLALGAPALADVKAGVNAWSAGDYATAVREWSGPAQAGDADAQFNLAQAYRLGRGVDADKAQAEALYAAAAAQGHVQASDNYGLLLFEDGRREAAMPYITAAAGRGDPRAQYLLGVAHFNGDLAEKDWPRAYALLTLANNSGLPQARAAMAQMDEFVPLADRQQAQVLAQQIKSEADANRARQLAAVDLGSAPVAAPVAAAPTRASAPTPAPRPVEVARADNAGADYTLPASRTAPTPVPGKPASQIESARAAVEASASAVAAPPSARATTSAPASVGARMSGDWKLQLGAFGDSGNAQRLASRLATNAALGGARIEQEAAGRLIKVMAVGYASRTAAEDACSALKRSGQDCLVTR